ncbi:MAG: acyl-CoA thioesterase [SAR324 cluster bacterium]|nr:acyl-CoA thioesterase [SAR324 cluster bacterium]
MKTPSACNFESEFLVRDYEVDMFGVVNHAVYLHYLEHTRHEFLKSLGTDAAKMQQEGYNLVVTHLEIDYKLPLRSGDHFTSRLAVSAVTRVRFVFFQALYNESLTLTTSAKIEGTSILPNGRPGIPAEFRDALLDCIAEQKAIAS